MTGRALDSLAIYRQVTAGMSVKGADNDCATPWITIRHTAVFLQLEPTNGTLPLQFLQMRPASKGEFHCMAVAL